MNRVLAVLLSALLCMLCTVAVLAEDFTPSEEPEAGQDMAEDNTREPDDTDQELDQDADQTDNRDDDSPDAPEPGTGDELHTDRQSSRGTTSRTAARSAGYAEDASTSFGLFVTEDDINQPTYTVTIPSWQELSLNGANEVTITASGLRNGEQVSVRLAGTAQDDRLVMYNNSDGHELYYSLLDARGNTLIAGPDGEPGAELVRFERDGAQRYRIAIQRGASAPEPVAGCEYVGMIYYDIALAA